MFDRISEDIKSAMKAKDKGRLETLRMLKSRLLENKTAPKPKAELDVVVSYAKGLRNALGEYPKGSEQANKIIEEISYLDPYLPQQLSKEAVVDMVREIMKEDPEINFGGVMKALSPKIKGSFDGKQASVLVRELLG